MRPGPQRRVEFSEAGSGDKGFIRDEIEFLGFRESRIQAFCRLTCRVRRSFPRVLNNPIRDGLGRVIGRNFVSNIRCL